MTRDAAKEAEIQATVAFLRERGEHLILDGRRATELCREFGIVTRYPPSGRYVLHDIAEYLWRRLNE